MEVSDIRQLNYEAFTALENFILSQPDPLDRAAMMAMAVNAGYAFPAESIIDALKDDTFIPSGSSTTPETVRRKSTVLDAVSGFLNLNQYDDIDRILDYTKQHQQRCFVPTVAALLRHGYAGLDSSLLSISADEVARYAIAEEYPEGIERPDSDPISLQADALQDYVEALATFGVDVHNSETAGDALLNKIQRLTPSKPFEEWRYVPIATAYAQGRHIDLACQLETGLRLGLEPTAPSVVDLRVAIAENSNPDTRQVYLESINSMYESLGSNHPMKEPIRLEYLRLIAQSGPDEADRIKSIIGEHRVDPEIRLKTLMEVYRQTGDLSVRAECISDLKLLATTDTEHVSDTIFQIAEIDCRFNNTVRTEIEPHQKVPRMAIDLDSLFSSSNNLEGIQRQKTTEKRSLPIIRSHFRKWYKQTFDTVTKDLSLKVRSETAIKDRSRRLLVPLLIANGAPDFAARSIDLIESEVDKAGAMAATFVASAA